MDETRTRTWKNFRPSVAKAGPASVSGTFIESGAVFEGTLTLKGDFRIDSEFRGELATDGEIVVGPFGSVEGNIKARQVEIQGAVVGNVTARRLFILRAGGHLHGDIETACLEIERHAFFRGGTRMTRPQAASLSNDADAGKAARASTPSEDVESSPIATF